VIAGKVLNLDGTQHRFAFARNGNSVSEFANAVVSAGIRLGTPATVLCDGDPGLWKLQRRVMPDATLVLDWFHIAMRFEHALQAARGLAPAHPAATSAVIRSPTGELQVETLARPFERMSWALGSPEPLFDAGHVRGRQRRGRSPAAHQRSELNILTPIDLPRELRTTAPRSAADFNGFVESAVNEILSKRMIKKQQMRWNNGPSGFPRRARCRSQQKLAGSFSGSIQISIRQ